MPATIREVCACGGSFEVEVSYAPDAARFATKWRNEHRHPLDTCPPCDTMNPSQAPTPGGEIHPAPIPEGDESNEDDDDREPEVWL